MEYYFNEISKYKNPVPLYFLCGVKYNFSEPDDDKRVVLKKYLESRGCCCIILEEHFVINKDRNGRMLGYKSIGLKNLNDVETLACLAVDGIFIIHESHSTAAEIALFASNECVAKKTFVLIPDEENAETNHFSGFLLAGYNKLIARRETFYPVIKRYVKNQNNIEIRTYFNNNKIGKNLGKKIDEFINNKSNEKTLKIKKNSYKINKNSNSYHINSSEKKVSIYIDLELLRYYVMAIFNINKFKDELRKTCDYFSGLTVCQRWLKKIFLNTIQKDIKQDVSEYEYVFEISNSINSRLDLRTAISFILYIFHAMKWIRIDPSNKKGISISKKTDKSSGFRAVYEKYSNIISQDYLMNLGSI